MDVITDLVGKNGISSSISLSECHWFRFSASLVKREWDSMSYVITPIKPWGREGRSWRLDASNPFPGL